MFKECAHGFEQESITGFAHVFILVLGLHSLRMQYSLRMQQHFRMQ